MKHIKLFESFDSINESQGISEDLVFDWLPFDDQINNPANSRLPQEIKYSELPQFCNEMGKEFTGVGLYIAHDKLSGGGFVRFILESASPILFNVAVFDKDFKKTSENKGIPNDKFNFKTYLRGTEILNRFKF
jgi:hypothetical protein